jgi:antitoxin (DNA-binding transcriptional repressor) of toxin-antitoxin stability system
MKATIADVRYRLKDVLRAIDRGDTVTVLFRGKEKARLVPIAAKPTLSKASDHPACGMWADREDMADPAAFVRTIRKNRIANLLEDS